MSKLFSISQLNPSRAAGYSVISEDEQPVITRKGIKRQSAADVIGPIERGKTIHYQTQGKWSTHQVLTHILNHTGPAEVYISTYTVSENPARSIVSHVLDGLITSLYCLLDYRIKTYNENAYHLLEKNSRKICLIRNHSKLMVVSNSDWSITWTGSSNLNNNSRIEVGVLSTSPAIADFHRQWIMEKINGSERKTTDRN